MTLIKKIIIAVPISGCKIIRKTKKQIREIKGRNRFFSLLENQDDRYIIIENLANSVGCKLKKPRSIQRLAPPIFEPTPGMRTKTNRIIVKISETKERKYNFL